MDWQIVKVAINKQDLNAGQYLEDHFMRAQTVPFMSTSLTLKIASHTKPRNEKKLGIFFTVIIPFNNKIPVHYFVFSPN